MKKIVFAFCMMLGTAAAVQAQDTTTTQSPTDPTVTTDQSSTAMTQEDGRTKIKSQELPEQVKKTLEGQEYRGWLVSSAYKMNGASNSGTGTSGSASGSSSSSTGTSGSTSANAGSYNQEIFIVELKNGAQTKTVRFDKDGKVLDDAADDGDQK